MLKKKQNTKDMIRTARPKLSLVAPLTHKICIGFGLVNMGLAYILFNVPTTLKTAPFIITPQAGFISFPIWGIIYFVLGLVLLYAVARNDWNMLRKALIFGLFTKTIWTIALIILAFQGYSIFVTMTFWLFLAWTQAWTIVHFIPVITWDGEGGDHDDKR